MKHQQTSCYEDIIYLQRPESKQFPKMSAHDRAAQFSPFAALEGYNDILQEAEHGRITRPELLEEEKAEINDSLMYAAQHISEGIICTISYFSPDETGKTGWLELAVGRLKKIDAYTRTVEMEQGKILPIDNMIRVNIHQ